MKNESIIEKLARNLSFEIETATQSNPIRLKNKSKSTPLNVKVKVRKHAEDLHYGVISIPKTYTDKEKIRLANSDQTIMSFDLFMEPEPRTKPQKKYHNKFFKIIRQGTCLGTQDDDESYSYLPSSSNTQNLRQENLTSRSEGLLKNHTALSKRNYLTAPSSMSKRSNYFLGKCKPGGCLDPPFGEDRYSYTPTKETVIGFDEIPTSTNIESAACEKSSIRIKNNDNHDKFVIQTIANKQKQADSVLKLYEAGSVNTSPSTTLSSSIITYPPTLLSSTCNIYNATNMQNKTLCDINQNYQYSNNYFFPPKKINQHEGLKPENLKVDVTEDDTLLDIANNKVSYNIVDQKEMSNQTRVDPLLPYLDSNLEKNNTIFESEFVKENCCQHSEGDITHSQVSIDIVKSVTILPKQHILMLNNCIQEDSPLLPDEITLDPPIDISKIRSNHTLKEDFGSPKQLLKQIFEPNSPHSNFENSSNLTGYNILSNSCSNTLFDEKKESKISDQILIDNRQFKTVMYENISNMVNIFDNEQNNTNTTKNSEHFSEIGHYENSSCNGSINSLNLTSETKLNIYEDSLDITGLSIRSNDLNHLVYENSDKNAIERNTNHQINADTITYLTENLEIVTKEDKIDKYLKTKEVNDVSTNESNSSLKKSLSTQSISSANKQSIEMINDACDSKLSLQKYNNSSTEKSDIHLGMPKINLLSDDDPKKSKGEESFLALQVDSKTDVYKTIENFDNSNDSSTKRFYLQNLNTDIIYDKLRNTDLKCNSIDNNTRKLLEHSNQSPNKTNSFINVGLASSVHNNETIYNYMITQSPSHIKSETKTFAITEKENNEFVNSMLILDLNESEHSVKKKSGESRELLLNKINTEVNNEIQSKNSTIIDTPVITSLGNQKQYSNTSNVDTKILIDKFINSKVHLPIDSTNITETGCKNNGVNLDFAFRSYCDNKNQRFIKSYSSDDRAQICENGAILKITAQIKEPNYKLTVPINNENDLSILINQRNSHNKISSILLSKGTQADEELNICDNTKTCKDVKKLENYSLLSICEEELLTLQNTMKTLKEEIDSLRKQKTVLKNYQSSICKKKLTRFTNINKQCGCYRSYM